VACEYSLVGCIRVQPDLLEEVRGVVCEVPSAENLGCEYEAGNLRTSKFSTLEAIPIMSANCQLFLKVIGVDDSSQRGFGVDWG
jgi:hypothetical protein